MMVCVLMSTYNGELYIKEQIDSILCQKDVDVKLIVRDDGSTDSTCDILNEYRDKGLLEWYTGENMKPARSFMHMLLNAPECEYYSFADQDDIWYEDKLAAAVDAISREETASPDSKVLYVCNKDIVDAEGRHLYHSEYKFRQAIGTAFMECYSSGCCMVMNAAMREYVSEHQPVKWQTLHDYWIYLLAHLVGKVIFDNTPHMGYRLHGNNANGVGETGIMKKVKRLFAKSGREAHASEIAQQLVQVCGADVKAADQAVLAKVIKSKHSLGTRMQMLLSPDFALAGGDFKQKVYAKLKILFNKLY